MPGTDHHTDGRTGRTPTGNVVPLRPRQWLDPDVELVPITTREPVAGDDRTEPDGATASTSVEVDDGHASTWLGVGEHTVPITPTIRPASDFWGEDAADLLLAVEAPPAAAPEPPFASEPSEHGRRHLTIPRLPIPKHVPRPRVLAAAIVAAIAVALAIATLGPTAKRPPHAAPIQASVGTSAASSVASTARSNALQHSEQTATRAHHIAHPRVRTHATTPAPRVRTRHQHHRPTARVATAHTAAATPASATPPESTSPPPDTSVSSQGGAGPSGTVSLIGAGTSPSS